MFLCVNVLGYKRFCRAVSHAAHVVCVCKCVCAEGQGALVLGVACSCREAKMS